LASKHIGCLFGKGGNIISEMQESVQILFTLIVIFSVKAQWLPLGKGGNIISEMRRQTRANGKDGLPKCAYENEELVQITREPSVARDSLIQIITRLREDIFKDKLCMSKFMGREYSSF
jgi:hypothetical protein